MPAYYPLFVLTAALLIATPGPNVALIVANSVAYGSRMGLLTVLGTSAAAAIHMVCVGVGMSEGMAALGVAFEWIRWAGAAYLIVLGLRTWRAPPADLAAVGAQPRSVRTMLLRAGLVSLTNPKTLLFYGAFFPQFIDPARPVGPQLWVLCLTYIAVVVLIDCAWALAAGRARLLLARRARLRNRVTGGLLMGAGVGLALARPK